MPLLVFFLASIMYYYYLHLYTIQLLSLLFTCTDSLNSLTHSLTLLWTKTLRSTISPHKSFAKFESREGKPPRRRHLSATCSKKKKTENLFIYIRSTVIIIISVHTYILHIVVNTNKIVKETEQYTSPPPVRTPNT